MEENKDFKTADEIFREELRSEGILKDHRNNPYKIDTFWEVFNSSKCKTAMLIISVMITIGFIVTQVTLNPSPTLHSCFIIVIGYWMGRTSKAIENRRG